MGGHLLTLYESGKFSNNVKASKESFGLDPGTYCASLFACNTQQNFTENWGNFANGSIGMDDRFTFVIQPETLPELTVQQAVNTTDGAYRTLQLINKALNQKNYRIFDPTPLQQCAKLYGNRAEIRAEKWALYFAIDLGREEIDEECVDRGIALAKYEYEVKQYLAPRDAESKMAGWQQQAINILHRHDGRMLKNGKHGFLAAMDAARFDTFTWNNLYGGLKLHSWIREDGKGVKGDPTYVQLLRTFDFEGGDDE